MNFILKFPSLQHIALVNVAASVWNQHDIRTLVTAFCNSLPLTNQFIERGNKKEWQLIKDKVSEKVLQLVVPTCLKEEILVFIQSTGKQILTWINYHLEYCQLHLNLPSKFCWEPYGTINKKKTAEMLIRDDNVVIITRYKLACMYCLEEDIVELWNELPNTVKCLLYSVEKKAAIQSMNELDYFWALYINGEMDHLCKIAKRSSYHNASPYQYAFQLAVKSYNKSAAEYFLQKLELKNDNLLRAVNHIGENSYYDIIHLLLSEYKSETLFLLFSHMNEKQQVELCKRNPLNMLCCFLNWPWQSFFPEMLSYLWKFFNREDYPSVFRNIFKVHAYKKKFQNLWQQISDSDKSFIIKDEYLILVILYQLINVEDKENINLIFQNATTVEKNSFLFSKSGQVVFEILIHDYKWDLLKFIIQLMISSKDELIKLKEKFQDYKQMWEICSHKDKYDEFFLIIDDFILEYDKKETCG